MSNRQLVDEFESHVESADDEYDFSKVKDVDFNLKDVLQAKNTRGMLLIIDAYRKENETDETYSKDETRNYVFKGGAFPNLEDMLTLLKKECLEDPFQVLNCTMEFMKMTIEIARRLYLIENEENENVSEMDKQVQLSFFENMEKEFIDTYYKMVNKLEIHEKIYAFYYSKMVFYSDLMRKLVNQLKDLKNINEKTPERDKILDEIKRCRQATLEFQSSYTARSFRALADYYEKLMEETPEELKAEKKLLESNMDSIIKNFDNDLDKSPSKYNN